jgi:predicted CoA-substrate-specific enzyme activase
VDVGASATKVLLLDAEGQVCARVARPSGVDYAATARAALEEALETVGAQEPQVAQTVSTGYGRHNVPFAPRSMTEIQCHGVGCFHELEQELAAGDRSLPSLITVVDIGGQDNKVIRLDGKGRRLDFKMNRKCAAGTGAFIEEIALRLALPLEELEKLARKTADPVRLSSFCTVFAKTEILSHLRQGIPVERIVRGAFLSVVQRVVEMDPLEGEVVLTGGVVAYNPTVADILAERIGRKITVPAHPQFTGALGAALLARG